MSIAFATKESLTANVSKRKNSNPLSTAGPKRRFMPSLSQASGAYVSKKHLDVNIQIPKTCSSLSQDISPVVLSQPLLTPFNQDYPWQDVRGGVITPNVINFSNSCQGIRHLNHQYMKQSCVTSESARNQAFVMKEASTTNAGKRKNSQRLSASGLKGVSSSRSIKR